MNDRKGEPGNLNERQTYLFVVLHTLTRIAYKPNRTRVWVQEWECSVDVSDSS